MQADVRQDSRDMRPRLSRSLPRAEVTCATSSRNQAPKRPDVKCIDDCRRRQLAAAFSVDLEKKAEEEAATVYSDDTLEFYIDNKSWCTGIEKMLRDFCADKDKMRLAFKPMKSHLREFIHNLAENYGLDSESEDPEPYRSVVVTKNAHWSMPVRNLAEALKLRRKGDTTLAGVGVPVSAVQQLRKTQPVNAMLLSGLRVGLLTSELEADLQPVLRGSSLRFGIRWYGDEEVLLEPQGSSLSTAEIEAELHHVKPAILRHLTTYRIASSVELCWVGRDGKVANKEGHQTQGGWNVVSGKHSVRLAPQQTPQTGGSYANLFGVLGGGAKGGSFAAAASSKDLAVKSDVARAKNKVTSPVVPKEEPVDDWLEAVENEEREAEAKAEAKAAASAAASSVEDNGHSADEKEGKEGSEGKEELLVAV
ncbi:hypothetical protein ABW21_db0202462 [Orbilia brochopaga]|nr:hypothetical protein ABW21_db0202462 [Drechslerella brochopaga]